MLPREVHRMGLEQTEWLKLVADLSTSLTTQKGQTEDGK